MGSFSGPPTQNARGGRGRRRRGREQDSRQQEPLGSNTDGYSLARPNDPCPGGRGPWRVVPPPVPSRRPRQVEPQQSATQHAPRPCDDGRRQERGKEKQRGPIPRQTGEEMDPGHKSSSVPLQAASSKFPGAKLSDASASAPLSTTEELRRGIHECVICFTHIRKTQAIWVCRSQCGQVLHYRCMTHWARESDRLRCPACQYQYESLGPSGCYCGSGPPTSKAMPHSCGGICGKKLSCSAHQCEKVCHPGRCLPCAVMTPPIPCHCGEASKVLPCGAEKQGWSCGLPCPLLMNCGFHPCLEKCHRENGHVCLERVSRTCFCGRSQKDGVCGKPGPELSPLENEDGLLVFRFACSEPCGLLFDCGIHKCEQPCHARTNHDRLCPYDPSKLTRCPCGRQEVKRTSCEDPVETCDAVCGRRLRCSNADHTCPDRCHNGPCPRCRVSLTRKCRCGATTVTQACGAPPPLCTQKCRALRLCGRHSCGRECCPLRPTKKKGRRRVQLDRFVAEAPSEVEMELHGCNQQCGLPLSCGVHFCTRKCHDPRVHPCPPCLEASFDEYVCPCGSTTVLPPIRCGQELPSCTFPCQQTRPCGHPAGPHNCHPVSEDCPPCTILVRRRCRCGQSTVGNVPCYSRIQPVCSKPCGKPLICGNHVCKEICHAGPCKATCPNRCGKPRQCTHLCGDPCHGSERCPSLAQKPCRVTVDLTCPCGVQKEKVFCGEARERRDRGGFAHQTRAILACIPEQCAASRRALSYEVACRALAVEFPRRFQDFVLDNMDSAIKLETTLIDFLLNNQGSRRRYFTYEMALKRDARMFVYDLAKFYGISASSQGQDADEKELTATVESWDEFRSVGCKKLSFVRQASGGCNSITSYIAQTIAARDITQGGAGGRPGKAAGEG